MIEDRFRKWVQREMMEESYMDLAKSALDDDDYADDLWDEFERYHSVDFREMVRQQLKSIFRKTTT